MKIQLIRNKRYRNSKFARSLKNYNKNIVRLLSQVIKVIKIKWVGYRENDELGGSDIVHLKHPQSL